MQKMAPFLTWFYADSLSLKDCTTLSRSSFLARLYWSDLAEATQA